MSWVDKAHKKNKINKIVYEAMKDPRYQVAEKKKLDEAYKNAFNNFLLISADYMYRLGYRKKRLLRFLEFAVYQLHCIETDQEYFKLLNDALADETGIDILGILSGEPEQTKE